MPDYREPDEVIDTTAERIPQPEKAQPDADRQQVAIGGGIIPGPAASAGALLDQLEDGQLSYEMTQELRQLAEQIRNVANATGGKAKGELTMKLSLSLENDAFHIGASFKAKAPELPRRRSIMWQDDAGNFTRFPPNQTQMFGTAPIRRVG